MKENLGGLLIRHEFLLQQERPFCNENFTTWQSKCNTVHLIFHLLIPVSLFHWLHSFIHCQYHSALHLMFYKCLSCPQGRG